jgi:DNA-directed RNA polymerase sigma subunit (sigma70/sigma32)
MERDESLRGFLDSAGRRPLLDRAGEVELAQAIERGRAAAAALSTAADSEHAHLQRAGRCGEAARVRFVEANLRLVVSVARTFEGRGLARADLVQEGNAGLLRAVDGFEWRRGFKFST